MLVHFDNEVGFCENQRDGDVLTKNEDEVSCAACLDRLDGIDAMTVSLPSRGRLSLRQASKRYIDWFGGGD